MRTFKEETIILDEFTSEGEKQLGVLTFSNEFDNENDLIYIKVGKKRIGWVTRRELLEACKTMLKLWPITTSQLNGEK